MNNAVRWTPEEAVAIGRVQDYLQERAGSGRRVTTSEALRWCVQRGIRAVELSRALRAAKQKRKDRTSAD